MSDYELEQILKLKYFTAEEINKVSFGTDFGFSKMESIALIKLDELRQACGFPFRITCAFRTPEWDKSKGRSGKSKHTLGIAFDIACTNSAKRSRIVREASKMGFNGIGIHNDFVHLDIRNETPVMWLY